jgi:membrane protease YdiL (CAAX protease family)
MRPKINYFAILTFYTIAISLRYLTNKTALLNGISNDFLKVLLQGIGPAVGAIIAFSIFKIKPILTLKGNYKKIFYPFMLFWMLPIILIWSVEYYIKGIITYQAVIAILIYGLLEEIGWRGFLQQELKPLSQFSNILIVAVLWFIWHLNFDFTSSNLLFFGILLLGTWGIGKLADNTHSLLAISAFHSLNNFFPEMNQIRMLILLFLLMLWITSLVVKKRQMNKNIS